MYVYHTKCLLVNVTNFLVMLYSVAINITITNVCSSTMMMGMIYIAIDTDLGT